MDLLLKLKMSSDLLSGSRPTFWNFQVIWITWQSQMPNETATGMLNPFWMVKDRKMLFSHICTTFRRSWKLLLRKIQRLPPLMSSAQVFRLVGASEALCEVACFLFQTIILVISLENYFIRKGREILGLRLAVGGGERPLLRWGKQTNLKSR